MANETKPGAAQNKLGELFVDFGSSGLGTLLKGLNSVSASFLLTKNAAQQFIKPLVDTSKQSVRSAVDVSKLSTSLGATLVDTQKLINYFKQNNLDESMLGNLSGLSKNLTDVHLRLKGMDAEMATVMTTLGLDWEDYDGSLESILQFIKDVEEATRGLDANIARSYLNKLGLSDEWLYAFQRNGFNLSDAFLVSDEAIQSQLDAAEAMNKAKLARDAVVSEIVGKGANIATPIFEGAAETIEGVRKNKPESKTEAIRTSSATVSGAGIGAAIGSFGGPIGTGIGAIIGGTIGLGTELYNAGKNKINKGQTTGQAADLGYIGDLPDFKGAELPPNISSMTQNITNNITHDITINSNNPSETADRIASISSQDIQYTQYQANNLAGI